MQPHDREAAMRRRIPETGPIPPLAARPDVQPGAGQCTSCAEALPEGTPEGTRCEPCIRAAWAVLGWGEPPAAEARAAPPPRIPGQPMQW